MVEVEKIITKEVPKFVEVPVDRIVTQVRFVLLGARKEESEGRLCGPRLKTCERPAARVACVAASTRGQCPG